MVRATDLPAEMVAQLRVWHDQIASLDRDALISFAGRFAKLRAAVDAVWVAIAGACEDQGLSHGLGFRTTEDWLSSITGDRRGVMRRDVELACALAEAPAVGEAMRDGLSKAKAVELVEAASLPVGVQSKLIAQAASLPVAQVASIVRRAKLDHGCPEREVDLSATISRHRDRVTVEATLDLVGGEVVQTALDTIALQLAKDIPFKARRAHALVALARYWLDHAKNVPSNRLGRPNIIVHVDINTLATQRGGSATLGSGAVIPGNAARQIACDANLTRVVFDAKSEPLDVGRTTRDPPVGLTKAVIARDRHCCFVDCHAPPWLCEMHHFIPWTPRGKTAIDNLGLVCWYHHHEIHRRGAHLLTKTREGRWTLSNRARDAAT